MTILLISGIGIAFLLILLLMGKKQKRPSDLYLGIMIGLYGLSSVSAYLEFYNHQNNFPYPFFINLGWLLLFLHGPALWFYIQSLTKRGLYFRPVYLLHFVPVIIFAAVHFSTFVNLPPEEKIFTAQNETFRSELFFIFSVISIAVSTMSYNIWALLRIRNHRKRIMQNFSRIENIDLNWLRLLIIAAISVYLVNVFLFNLNNIYPFASYITLILVTYSFGAIYILFLGYFGLQQGNIFTGNFEVTANEAQSLPETTTSVKPQNEMHQKFVEILSDFMERRQPYLDPEITLAGLSERLKVKPEFLSEILNTVLKQNFFDFINKHRIEEFKIQSQKASNRHLSILGLAYECGFNSKAAFYRAFKKFEGTLPSAYVSKVSQ